MTHQRIVSSRPVLGICLLLSLAMSWTVGAQTTEERLKALENKIQKQQQQIEQQQRVIQELRSDLTRQATETQSLQKAIEEKRSEEKAEIAAELAAQKKGIESELEPKLRREVLQGLREDKHLISREGRKPLTLGPVSAAFGLTGVLQGTAGRDKDDPGAGNHTDGSWSNDIDLNVKLAEDSRFFLHFEGGNGSGLDARIPTFSGTNQDVFDSEASLEMDEAWYQVRMLDKKMHFTGGKVDMTNYFDANEVANDEKMQFLSPSLVNSLAVEWPQDESAGVEGGYDFAEWLAVSVGWAEADANWDDILDKPFAIAEVDLRPTFSNREGNYRFYGWYNGRNKPELDGDSTDKKGHGFGMSADQEINDAVTLFARAGWEDDQVYTVEWAWSAGFQVTMNSLNRPNDIFAAAFGRAITSDVLDLEDEDHLEIYYSIYVHKFLQVTPDFQYFWDPAGDPDADDFAVFGLRAQVVF